MTKIEKNRSKIKKELSNILRLGMPYLIDEMDDIGFFEAPCSGGNHLCEEGGLAEHSLNVLNYSKKIAKALWNQETYQDNLESLTIVSLLHDIGKCGQYGKAYYTPNMIKDGRPTKADPEQHYKQSEAKPWEINPNLEHVDHAIRSVIIINECMGLTEDEQTAILYHDGLYGALKYEIPGHETPLMLILHWADMWASHIVEDK